MLMRLHASAVALAIAGAVACAPAAAQPAAAEKKPAPAAAKPAPKPAAKKPVARKAAPAKKVVPPAVVYVLPEASAEQLAAAENIYYGAFDCEFKQSIHIEKNGKFTGYADVKYNKGEWTMKPVLSSTGAMRLEDVKGETLIVQIASKSMLMNVKTGQRLVDERVSPRQRELIEAARAAKVAEAEAAASAAASGASAPEKAPGLLR
jgi:hypothetical protein